MKIVFLIGNGFDLNLGLKTSYGDFYPYYFEQRKDDDRRHIQEFIKSIRNNKYKNWADLEYTLGQHLSAFSPDEASLYADLWSDLLDTLADYIQAQTGKIEYRLTRNGENERLRYLLYPDSFLKQKPKTAFDVLRGSIREIHTRVDVINFNYTRTFEGLYGPPRHIQNNIELGSITHIHGLIDEDMILGVNDSSQLEHDWLRDDPGIVSRLVKPIANENAGSMRSEICLKHIRQANIICIFGMSLGATDKYWWNAVSERLKSQDARLIIFARDGSIAPRTSYLNIEKEKAKINNFLEQTDLNNEDRELVRDKINICFNSRIFGQFQNMIKSI